MLLLLGCATPVEAPIVVIDGGFAPGTLAGSACFAPECAVTAGHGAHLVEVMRRETDLPIVGLTVLDPAGSFRQQDLVAALDWVHAHRSGVRVVNVSLGLSGPDGGAIGWADPATCAAANPALAFAVGALVADGITVVAAAGDDFYPDRLRAPACLPGVVSVGAADAQGQPAPSANHTPARWGPGVAVPVGGTTASGSSLAAAWVSARLARGAPTAW